MKLWNGVIVSAVLAAGAATAAAQPSVFYNKPTAAQQAQMQDWGQKYSTLTTTGAPAPGASGFAFSTPAMNTPLFSPLRGAELTTITAIGGGSGANCAEVAPIPDVVAMLTTGSIASGISTEPDKTLSLLETAASDDDVVLDIVGDALVASNLTPTQVSGTPGAKVWANASSATLAWIANLDAACDSWATTLSGSDDAKRRLLGTARTVDQLESSINAWADINGLDITTVQAEARFGAFEALPLIVAVYTKMPDSGFLLIDGVTGTIDGPFASGTTINPSTLLLQHADAYSAGTAAIVQLAGFWDGLIPRCMPRAPAWRDGLPGPIECSGCGPWLPPFYDPAGFRCTDDNPALGTECTCGRSGSDVRDPGGRVLRSRQSCSGDCSVAPGRTVFPPDRRGLPTLPPYTPGGISPIFTCTDQYWY